MCVLGQNQENQIVDALHRDKGSYNLLGFCSTVQIPVYKRLICREYRKIDGSCNNEDNPLYGMSGVPFQRLVRSTYKLRRNEPRRTSVNGQELPSARRVSNAVFSQDGEPGVTDTRYTQLLMQMGTFVIIMNIRAV